MKVSDYIAQSLQNLGVHSLYGYTGGAITHIVDSFCQHSMPLLSCGHEQGAIFSASAVAKATRKLQVIAVTSGPGATNLITGIAEAYFDSAPLLILSGQVNTYDFKWDKKVRQMGFQETDIVSIVKPITKYAVLVDDPSRIAHELEKAVRIALEGRPGPVVLDIPMNVQRADIPNTPFVVEAPTSSDEISNDQLLEAANTLRNAKRPLIFLGAGCKAVESAALTRIAELLDAPVAVSLLGKGGFPEDHPSFLGFAGSYGHRYANIALARSDCLLVLGARLDSRQTGNKLDIFSSKHIIQVDIDRDEVGSKIAVAQAFYVDTNLFADRFLAILEKQPHAAHTTWNTTLHKLRDRFSTLSELERAAAEPFQYKFMQLISDNLSADDIVVADIGQIQMIAAQVLKIRANQKFITSGGMAPMGYALPGSIGVANETKRRVISINGDGGMQMNIQELNTLQRTQAPVLAFVFDNKSLGMIKQFQELYFDGRYFGTDEQHEYYSCDFAKIAEAYGISTMRIHWQEKNWEQQLLKAMSAKLPLVVHVVLDYETKVFPKLRFDRALDDPEPEISDDERTFINHLLAAPHAETKQEHEPKDAYYDG